MPRKSSKVPISQAVITMRTPARIPKSRAVSFVDDAPIRKKPEQVARMLRSRIVRGELKAGEYLPPEAELLRQLGISRPTLREALRILESESLLTITRSRNGPRINLPSPDIAAQHFGLVLQSVKTTIADVYHVRTLFAPVVVRHLAMHSTPRMISTLNAAIDLHYRALDDIEHHIGPTEVRFHELLFELTGNKALSLLIHMLHTIYERHLAVENAAILQRKDAPQFVMLMIHAHERLVELIKAGDAPAAELFWTKHLQAVEKNLYEWSDMSVTIDMLE